MKHFILTFVLFTVFTSKAQTTGELVFFSNLGEKFYVILNGVQQNQLPESNVRVSGLKEGWYSCRVVSENNLFSLEQNVGVGSNLVITYRILNKKGSYKLRYFTEVPLNSYAAPQDLSTVVYHTEPYPVVTSAPQTITTPAQTVTTIPTQTTQTTTTQTTTQTTNTSTAGSSSTGTNGEQINMNVGTTGTTTGVGQTGGVNEAVNINIGISATGMNTQVVEPGMEQINMNVGINATGINQQTEQMNTNIGVNGTGSNTSMNTTQSQTITTTTTTTSSNGSVLITPNPTTVQTPTPTAVNPTNCIVDNPGMEKALTMVKNESFAEDKMRVAKQFARSKCLTVDQIGQFGKLFSFSEDIMEFVKFAHPNCLNKGDYFELMELFTFSEDKEELENFLNAR